MRLHYCSMSFGCKYNSAEGYCRRLDAECKPGVPGCVLYGRFTFSDDDRVAGPVSAQERSRPGAESDAGTSERSERR